MNTNIYSPNTSDLNFEKIWALFQETDKKFKETDKKIKVLTSLFTTQWGKLMEALIEPSCLKLFKDRNIDIHQSYSNVKVQVDGEDLETEFDIILANGSEVVVIEVKTTMKIDFVNDHLEKLKNIRKFFPKWKDMSFYGALAAIKYEEESTKYAYRKGLFVLKNAGEGIIKIANNIKFKPKAF